MELIEKVLVLKGGHSSEREISLISAKAVEETLSRVGYEIESLDPADFNSISEMIREIEKKKPEIVFNALHGGYGEDGRLQAALELSGIAFTGTGSKGSLLAMDKYVSKLIATAEGIPVAKHILLKGNLLQDYNKSEDYAGFGKVLGFPIVVKPNDSGSSVGISLVERIEDLKEAVNKAFEQCSTVILEEFIAGREITVSILEGRALPVVEIRPKQGWYDFVNKYTKGNTEYLAPAPLAESVSQLAQLYAERIFTALSCQVYARIDFRLRDDVPYFLEANTLPGMTALSLTPMAAKAAGLSFEELLKYIITGSLKIRKEET